MAWNVIRQEGLSISGSAVCRPSQLAGDSYRFDNRALWRALWGDAAEQELIARGWSSDRPLEKWGVGSRDWCAPPNEDACLDVVDLAAGAAREVLDEAGIVPQALDAIVFATSTPSRVSRSDAHRLAHRLGSSAASWDVKAGGGGGLLAMVQGALAVRSGAAHVLVVASEVATPYLSPDHPAMWAVYGDGAVAFLLGEGGESLLGARFGHESAPGKAMTITGELPPRAEVPFLAQLPDREYQESVATVWDRAIDELKELRQLADLDAEAQGLLFAPYGVTRSQVESTSRRLEVARSETYSSLLEYGCVGCAGALVAWHLAQKSDDPRPLVASAAVGGGVSWASVLWQRSLHP